MLQPCGIKILQDTQGGVYDLSNYTSLSNTTVGKSHNASQKELVEESQNENYEG